MYETLYLFFLAIINAILLIFVSTKFAGFKKFKFLSERSNRFGALDGLRGYLALAVFVHHFVITWYWKKTGVFGKPPEAFIENLGKVGVAIFFMITGFLFISKLIKDNGTTNWLALFQSRVFRIYPLYIFASFVIFLIVAIQTNFELNVEIAVLFKQYTKWMFYNGGKINGFADTGLIISGVDWTLKYEWLFYLSLPFISIFFKAGKLAITLLVAVTVLLFLYPQQIFIFYSKYFVLFAIGGIVAFFNTKGAFGHMALKSNGVSLLTFLSLVVCLFYPYTFTAVHILLMTIFFTLVALGNNMFGIFSSKASIFLGEISFSIYLLHGLVLYLMFSMFDFVNIGQLEFVEYLWLFPLVLLVVIIVSICSFVMIEMPFLNYGKKSLIAKRVVNFFRPSNANT